MAQSIRTFRIFVSSTFNDLREERNALQRHVFPRLKQLCAASGTRFQAIDLRWGVPEEAGRDQRTMQICLDEVERCRVASPRPNFVVLLGNRYGWQPLPASIPAREFDALKTHVPEGDRGELERAYARDDNAVPPSYRLRPRTIGEGQTAGQEAAAWRVTEANLRRLLLHAIAAASIPAEDRPKYEASATEQEIRHGALAADDTREHVFAYFRELTNVDHLLRDLDADLPDHDRAANFVDTVESGALDSSARARLDQLKATLATRLPDNVRRYQTTWVGRAAAAGAGEGRADAVVRAVADALAAAVKDARARDDADVRAMHL